MKICIIAFAERNYIPYIEHYENLLKKYKVAYDCVFWDRYNDLPTEKKDNEYTIHIKCMPGANKLSKIIPMYKYKKIVENIIKKQNYTHLVVLTTLPGVLISNLLLNKYRNKYILDIRDYTYEKYSFYKNIVDRLVEESYFTAISSKGFLKFLKNSRKIMPCHNIGEGFKEESVNKDLKNKNKVTIGFVGCVRYYNEDRRLIESLANNNKYKLLYIGKQNIDFNLNKFCEKSKITNVLIRGEFKNTDKPNIYKEIDIINSFYGNDSLEVTTLLPNRLYDGLIFKKPILASKGTYLGDLIEKNKIGCVLDPDNIDNIDNVLNNFMERFDCIGFEQRAKKLLIEIKYEQEQFYRKIIDFINRS